MRLPANMGLLLVGQVYFASENQQHGIRWSTLTDVQLQQLWLSAVHGYFTASWSPKSESDDDQGTGPRLPQ